jgi:enoyl-CoA hydratase
MTGAIRSAVAGPIGQLIIDHSARRNALTAQMWRDLPAIARELDAHPAVRVIVMRGEGDQAFVSGADISQFSELRSGEGARAYEDDNVRAFQALSELNKPLIAMIHGFCIGGGVALAVCADVRYAADDATFGVPAARLGLGYPLAGMATLIQLLGPAHAKELCFSARRIDAHEARRIGLINEVCPKLELERRVQELALGMADNAPLTLRAFKHCAGELMKPEAERDLDRARAAIEACYASADYREGIDAFLQKRAPKFVGA